MLQSCTEQTLTAAMEEMELTAAQGHLMGYLIHSGEPRCPRDVERVFHLSHPTVSGILSRLEQKGFVELITDPNDRRSKQIVISEKGLACHERMHAVILENESRIVQGFSPEEKAQFTQFLQRAIDNVRPDSGCPSKEEKKA